MSDPHTQNPEPPQYSGPPQQPGTQHPTPPAGQYPSPGAQYPPPGAQYPTPAAGQYPPPGAQYPPSGWTPPPPPPIKKQPPIVWIGIAAVVVVVVALAIVLVTRSGGVDDAKGTDGRSLSLPQSVDGYTQLTSVDTESLKQQLGSQLGAIGGDSSAVTEHAKIGVYSTGTTPELIIIGLPVSTIPSLRDQVDSDGVEASVKQFVDGATTKSGGDSSVASPGPKGGFMRCGTATQAGQQLGVCGWGDRSIFALTLVLEPDSADRTATVTRDLRAAAES